MNAAMEDRLPEEDHGSLSTMRPGWVPATPEVPAFGLLHLLFPLSQLFQAARGQGPNLSDLNPAHCTQGPAPGAGREELQANKVEKVLLGVALLWRLYEIVWVLMSSSSA